jgi:hypothetical protein
MGYFLVPRELARPLVFFSTTNEDCLSAGAGLGFVLLDVARFVVCARGEAGEPEEA